MVDRLRILSEVVSADVTISSILLTATQTLLGIRAGHIINVKNTGEHKVVHRERLTREEDLHPQVFRNILKTYCQQQAEDRHELFCSTRACQPGTKNS